MTDIVRWRAHRVPSPTNPERFQLDWADPERLDVDGWVDVVTSTVQDGADRTATIGTATLYCSDPAVDVQLGDRIEYAGATWVIHGFPDSPANPFTGWRPYRAVALKLVSG